MNHKEPIYCTPVETYLAQDRIIPYGGRVSVSSESWLRDAALRFLGGDVDDKGNDEYEGIDL